jgi:queuine/archaeosine tRNA-ribosyltransferase
MGFDTHMILETVPVLPSTRQNAHQAINRTPRHYAEALAADHPVMPGSAAMALPSNQKA